MWSHLAPWGYRSFDDSRTLATALRRSGYHTGFIGKYLNGYGPQRSRVSGVPSWRYVPRGWTDWRAAFAAQLIGRLTHRRVLYVATLLHDIATGRDGDAVVGTVRAVSPGVDAASRTGTVFADLPEPAGLQPGTYLEGRISTGLATVPVVPVVGVHATMGRRPSAKISRERRMVVAVEERRVGTSISDPGAAEMKDALSTRARGRTCRGQRMQGQREHLSQTHSGARRGPARSFGPALLTFLRAALRAAWQ